MGLPVLLTHTETADYSVRLVRYAPYQQMASHAHDEDAISVVLDGDLVEEAQNHVVVASAGWAVIKPRGVLHANRFGEHGATLLALNPRGHLARDVPGKWEWQDRPAALQHALRFISAANSARTDFAVDTLIDLLAALAPAARRPSHMNWLRRVKRLLEEIDAPPVATLAADAGVHPVYLARAFRAAFGVSLRDYRQLVQLRRAIQLVVHTRLPLTQIAMQAGFSDHSHMCRQFRRIAGWSPRVLRGPRCQRLATAAETPAAP